LELKYEQYEFSPVLGWSVSRYEMFDKCKRQYYYNYYSKYITDVPSYKLNKLKNLTSVALETGNVVHDVLEAFLKRLQKSDKDIDDKRFYEFARSLATKYFAEKTFMEIHYNYVSAIDIERVFNKVETCLTNFMNGAVYAWIFMAAIRNRSNWMIEPEGYGETRLDGLKAYCKMDFLLPLDKEIYILDWKTGAKDIAKHTSQLLGYAAATNNNFKIPLTNIFPKIVYLYPVYDELEIECTKLDFPTLYKTIREQTLEMYSYCTDYQNNIPKPIDSFPMSPSQALCKQCRFQELCFKGRAEVNTSLEIEW
jgi:hypothetical protein